MTKKMKKMLVAAACLACAQTTLSATAVEAAQCAARTHVKAQLSQRFGENLTAVSAPRRGSVLEIYASRNAETWTVMLSLPEGLSCLVAAGRGSTTLESRFGRHVLRQPI